MVISLVGGHQQIAAAPTREKSKFSGQHHRLRFVQDVDEISKLTPLLSLLLVHDFLLKKGGIALPASHGLRTTIERQKARLNAEFTRARIRRKCASVDALRELIEDALYSNSQHPRWIRINTLNSTVDEQLASTFASYQRADSIHKVLSSPDKLIYVDEHIPNLVAVSPRFDFAKSDAYKSGAVILQDKASCFPAYLLNPQPEDKDVIDGCAAPGNKTTHLAAIIKSRCSRDTSQPEATVHAFEKDPNRAKTLEKMVKIAGTGSFTRVHPGQDFLKVDPSDQMFSKVGAILLDPSCSGSGIVGRDDMPELHLPMAPRAQAPSKTPKKAAAQTSRKRKRHEDDADTHKVMIDDDGNTTVATSEKDLKARLEALSSFQLSILLHAFNFPAARKITYSTCSFHAEENEHVVLKALRSGIAQKRGWRVLPREAQISGMKAWPVRGLSDACNGASEVAEACIRAYKDDGRGVMGFFVAAFVCDGTGFDASTPNGETGKEPRALQNGPARSKGPQNDDGPANDSSLLTDGSSASDGGADTADEDDGSDWDGFDD